MRNIKNIKLDDSRSVTLLELRVSDVRRMMGDSKALEEVTLHDLFGVRFFDLPELLGDCIQLPPGETMADLSFSEIEQIKEAFVEVNTSFLDLLGLAALAPETQEATRSPNLTAPASS